MTRSDTEFTSVEMLYLVKLQMQNSLIRNSQSIEFVTSLLRRGAVESKGKNGEDVINFVVVAIVI